MSQKILLGVAFIGVGLFGYTWYSGMTPADTQAVVAVQDTASTTMPATPTATTPTNPTPTTPVTPKPTPKPAPTSFTLAQVATHNSVTNCWSVVNGKVYNLTSWISQHPGGKQAIESMCGKDASAAFDGQHGGQPRPASELAGFAIGSLAQ